MVERRLRWRFRGRGTSLFRVRRPEWMPRRFTTTEMTWNADRPPPARSPDDPTPLVSGRGDFFGRPTTPSRRFPVSRLSSGTSVAKYRSPFPSPHECSGDWVPNLWAKDSDPFTSSRSELSSVHLLSALPGTRDEEERSLSLPTLPKRTKQGPKPAHVSKIKVRRVGGHQVDPQKDHFAL